MHKIFLNFLDNTNQEENAIVYLEQQMTTLMERFTDCSVIRYLDIGCGGGYKTNALIKVLAQFKSVQTIALDPSAQLLTLFKDQLHNDWSR